MDYMTMLYNTIYASCFDNYDKIIKEFPDVSSENNLPDYIKNMKLENPNVTLKEQVAHAITMSILLQLMIVNLNKNQ